MNLNPFTFHAPKTLAEACALRNQLKDAKILAGGTFLINSLKVLKKKGLKTPQHIISLNKIAELKGICTRNESLTVGAMTTIGELYTDSQLTEQFPVIKTACRQLGTTPIRNMATIGGNLTCRYTWTELPAVMLALNAQFNFATTDKPESIDAETFFRNNARSDNILTHITIKKEPGLRSTYLRVSKSSEVDIPLLAVCCHAQVHADRFQNTRIVVNTATAFAQRDYSLENFLNNQKPDTALAEKALAHRSKSIYETSDEYKKHMFTVTLKSAITELIGNSK